MFWSLHGQREAELLTHCMLKSAWGVFFHTPTLKTLISRGKPLKKIKAEKWEVPSCEWLHTCHLLSCSQAGCAEEGQEAETGCKGLSWTDSLQTGLCQTTSSTPKASRVRMRNPPGTRVHNVFASALVLFTFTLRAPPLFWRTHGYDLNYLVF